MEILFSFHPLFRAGPRLRGMKVWQQKRMQTIHNVVNPLPPTFTCDACGLVCYSAIGPFDDRPLRLPGASIQIYFAGERWRGRSRGFCPRVIPGLFKILHASPYIWWLWLRLSIFGGEGEKILSPQYFFMEGRSQLATNTTYYRMDQKLKPACCCNNFFVWCRPTLMIFETHIY